MADPAPLRWRDSPLVIVADYLTHLPATAVIVAGLWAFGSRTDGLLGSVLTALSVGYLVLAAAEPVFRQATHCYEATQSALRHDMGLVERRRRDFPWRSIAAVNIERPWAHRLLGLHRLTLVQAGDESTRVVLRGVTRPTVDLVLARLEAALPAGQPPVPAPARQDNRTIYAASTTELVLMSFVYGQVLILAAAGAASLWEVLEAVGLLAPLGSAAGLLPLWAQIGVAAGAAALIGVGATVVRFFGFRASVDDRGRLSIRFGLLESQERRIDPGAVEGVVVHRNLLEQWGGRARLALLTTDSAAQLRSNLVLPSLPVDIVRAISKEFFPELVATDSLLEQRPRRVRALLVSLGLLGVPVGVGLGLDRWTTLPLWAVLVAALTVLSAGSLLGTAFTTRFSSEDGRGLTHTTKKFAAERQTTLRSRAVGQVAAVGWLRPRPRYLWVSLGAYAGRPLRFVALGHPRGSIEMLTRLILSRPGGARPMANGEVAP